MVAEAKILTSRRAYDYAPDDIRLTVLSTPGVQQVIQQLFGFQAVQIGTPPGLFGPVPLTAPPGLVFAMGVHALPDNAFIPIRSLQIEPRRIIVEVAGPSADIDPVFARLMEVFSAWRAQDGTLMIGEPLRTFDYSEASVHFSFAPDAILPIPLRDVLSRALGADADVALIPLLEIRIAPPDAEYGGAAIVPQAFHLELRAGATPTQGLYFSGAPLPSAAHLELIAQLAALLTPEGQEDNAQSPA